MTVIHSPERAGACARPWGRGRWFGPLHMCALSPYHLSDCKCWCGAECPREPASHWSWPAPVDESSEVDGRAEGTVG